MVLKLNYSSNYISIQHFKAVASNHAIDFAIVFATDQAIDINSDSNQSSCNRTEILDIFHIPWSSDYNV